MPDIDIVDASWIDAQPATVGVAVADATRWREWWPDLDLDVDELRGAKGVRWFVRSVRDASVRAGSPSGDALHGSMEIWLQPADGGTVAHYFLRLDGSADLLRPRERARLVERYRFRAKKVMWGLADELDPGRLARISGPPDAIP